MIVPDPGAGRPARDRGPSSPSHGRGHVGTVGAVRVVAGVLHDGRGAGPALATGPAPSDREADPGPVGQADLDLVRDGAGGEPEAAALAAGRRAGPGRPAGPQPPPPGRDLLGQLRLVGVGGSSATPADPPSRSARWSCRAGDRSPARRGRRRGSRGGCAAPRPRARRRPARASVVVAPVARRSSASRPTVVRTTRSSGQLARTTMEAGVSGEYALGGASSSRLRAPRAGPPRGTPPACSRSPRRRRAARPSGTDAAVRVASRVTTTLWLTWGMVSSRPTAAAAAGERGHPRHDLEGARVARAHQSICSWMAP